MKFPLQYAKLLSQKFLNIDDDIIPEIEMCLEREGDEVSIPFDVEDFIPKIEGDGFGDGFGNSYGNGYSDKKNDLYYIEKDRIRFGDGFLNDNADCFSDGNGQSQHIIIKK